MGIYLILLYFMLGGKIRQGKRGVSVALTTMMLIMVGGEATYNAVDSMKDIDKEVAYSTRASYQNYVRQHRCWRKRTTASTVRKKPSSAVSTIMRHSD